MRPSQRYSKKKNRVKKAQGRDNVHENGQKLARNSPPVTLKITHIGARGDGVGYADYVLDYQQKTYPFFVAGTLPDEMVCVQPQSANTQGIRANLIELIQASPERQPAPCSLFGQCGGCQLQHLSKTSYQGWKQHMLKKCLSDVGLSPLKWLASFWGEQRTRRRITLSYRRTEHAAIIGFLGRQSHFILNIEECVILHPTLLAMLKPLRNWAELALQKSDSGRMQINLLDEGVDITLLPDQQLSPDQLTVLASTAAQTELLAYLARLSILQPDSRDALSLLAPKSSRLSSFGVPVTLPAATFLQASVQGEDAMRSVIQSHCSGNQHIIDLFCGSGTLSIGLLKQGIHITAMDEDGAAISAYETAAQQAGFGQQARFERRNLFIAPLMANELELADTVILDPPRQGAQAQAELLKSAKVPQILMVSCHPRSFARDLAILTSEGQYVLESVMLIDQFVYSTHIEAFACLRHVDG